MLIETEGAFHVESYVVDESMHDDIGIQDSFRHVV